MKRLLAYLFIVFGLGLVFSVNADAKDKIIAICDRTDSAIGRIVLHHFTSKQELLDVNLYCPKGIIVNKSTSSKLYSKLKSKFKNGLNEWGYIGAGELSRNIHKYGKKITSANLFAKKDQYIDLNNLSSMDDFVVWVLTYKDKFDRHHIFNSIYDIKSPEKQILDFTIIETTRQCLNKIDSSNSNDCYLIKVEENRISGVNTYNLEESNQLKELISRSNLKETTKAQLISGIKNYKKQQTQIVKTEPSQTQEVAGNNTVHFCDNRGNYGSQFGTAINNYFISSNKICNTSGNRGAKKISEKDYILGVLDLNENTEKDKFLEIRVNNLITQYEAFGLNTQLINKLLISFDGNSLIAKKEPSQTQEVFDPNSIAALLDKSKEELNHTQEVAKKVSLKNSLTLSEEDALKAQIFGCWTLPLGLPYNEDLKVRIKLRLKPDGSVLRTEILDHERTNEPGQGFYKVLAESALRAIKLCQPLRVPTTGYERWKDLVLNFDAREMLDLPPLPDTEIAKVEPTGIWKIEPTVTPKKKKKVKLAKTTQEEFKPETGDIDNDAPVIEIAEAITVVSQSYTIKGTVKDKSKIYLTIDGRQVQVKKGKFKVDRFNIDPGEVEEIKIVAIDKWNNKSEKTIKVTIDLQSTDIAKVYEELKPNRVKVFEDKNKIAIIIGIEKYEKLTNLDAKYANRDAKAFRAYATQALGVKPSNIKLLVDEKADRGNTLEVFKLWLPKIANNDGKDIYVFFAGHGLASENGEDLYILPHDGKPKMLDDTAITRVELISLIQKVNPKSVTMFFDTCYSGQTRDERMLVASLLRPIQIVADEQETPDNFTIFSASNFDQASGGIEEAKHGMFSYYLMKGLEGKADEDKDNKITNGELIAYLKTNVSKEAFTQNREQDPMLSGNPDQVLMRYR